jgi:hypothetical protein
MGDTTRVMYTTTPGVGDTTRVLEYQGDHGKDWSGGHYQGHVHDNAGSGGGHYHGDHGKDWSGGHYQGDLHG